MPKTHHCYILPYYIGANKKIQVLLGKKHTVSKELGYIHNNPGQLVVVGGGCGNAANRHVKNKTRNAAMREFTEETGLDVNVDDITGGYKARNYDVFYLKIHKKTDYMFMNRRHPSFDTHFIELKSIKWYDFSEAKRLMSSNNNFTDFTVGDIKKFVKDWRTNTWNMDEHIKNLYNFSWQSYNKEIRYARKQGATKTQIDNLKKEQMYLDKNIGDNMYERNIDELSFEIYVEYFFSIIEKRSQVDWFVEILNDLKNNI